MKWKSQKTLPLMVFLIFGLASNNAIQAAGAGTVKTMRVPNGGIQPQIVQDAQGVVHLIYFKGEPKGGDIFYVRSKDGDTFSDPIKVNSHPGSAVALVPR